MDQEFSTGTLDAEANIDWHVRFARERKGPWLKVEAFTLPMLKFWSRYYNPNNQKQKYSAEYDSLLQAISVKRGCTFEAIEEGFLYVRKGNIYKIAGEKTALREYAIVAANVAGLTAAGAAYLGYDKQIELLDDSLRLPPRNGARKSPNLMPRGVSQLG